MEAVMRGPILVAILGCALGVGLCSVTPAVADSNPTFYALEEASTFDYGCFEICACPIVTQRLRGRFELKPAGVDPLFAYYEVTNLKWQVFGWDHQRVDITGSGKYRVGGEFAAQHQLALDLKVGDQPEQHFDSGLIQGGGEFPKIDIQVSIHLEKTCFDTVINVVAVPVTAGVEGGGPRVVLQRVKPNPFRSGMEVDFTLRAAGAVELSILDLQGRAVRTIASSWLEAGPHSTRWDGRSDDGTECVAGVYFVRLRTEGFAERRAIVKL
jgi:hypothetical protein